MKHVENRRAGRHGSASLDAILHDLRTADQSLDERVAEVTRNSISRMIKVVGAKAAELHIVLPV